MSTNSLAGGDSEFSAFENVVNTARTDIQAFRARKDREIEALKVEVKELKVRLKANEKAAADGIKSLEAALVQVQDEPTTMNDLDGNPVTIISSFLDPVSKHDVGKAGRLNRIISLAVYSDLLSVLPEKISVQNPHAVLMDGVAEASCFLRSFGGAHNHLFNAAADRPERLAEWLLPVAVSSELVRDIATFLRGLIATAFDTSVANCWPSYTLGSFLKAAQLLNISIAEPEPMLNVQLLTGDYFELSLEELATMKWESSDITDGRRPHWPDHDDFQPVTNSDEVANKAKETLKSHMEQCTLEVALNALESNVYYNLDIEVIAEIPESANDSDWEYSLSSAFYEALPLDTEEIRVEEYYTNIRTRLEAFVAELSPHTCHQRSPTFRLSPQVFHGILKQVGQDLISKEGNAGDRLSTCTFSPSALNCAQQIVESFVFGRVIAPITIKHPSELIRCNLLLSDNDITMFGFCVHRAPSEPASEHADGDSDDDVTDDCTYHDSDDDAIDDSTYHDSDDDVIDDSTYHSDDEADDSSDED